MAAIGFGHLQRFRRLTGRSSKLGRPRCVLLDPLFKQGHLCLGQASRGWHFQAIIANRLHQQTGGRITGNDGRPAVSALQQCLATFQIESTFESIARMTLIAVFREKWSDLRFKELQLLGSE